MHYYQFNIGDYMSHTDFLTPIQDIAYRRLLDKCYLTEAPLPADPKDAAIFIRMAEHSDDVGHVLGKFFSKTSKGWINKRANEVIAEYHKKSEKCRAAAEKSWKSRRGAAPNGEY
jgi:uncharacterized protein YdaU (DUF1376 family)